MRDGAGSAGWCSNLENLCCHNQRPLILCQLQRIVRWSLELLNLRHCHPAMKNSNTKVKLVVMSSVTCSPLALAAGLCHSDWLWWHHYPACVPAINKVCCADELFSEASGKDTCMTLKLGILLITLFTREKCHWYFFLDGIILSSCGKDSKSLSTLYNVICHIW